MHKWIVNPPLLCAGVAFIVSGCNNSEKANDDVSSYSFGNVFSAEGPNTGGSDEWRPNRAGRVNYDDLEPYERIDPIPETYLVYKAPHPELGAVGLELEKLSPTSDLMEAWETTIGGPKLIRAIREEGDSDMVFERTVDALFAVSELSAMKRTTFELGDKDEKFLCEKLQDTNFRKGLSKSIASRLYQRGQRFDSYDYVHYSMRTLPIAAQHPLANLSFFCDIDENDHDLKFAILNHKFGRYIKNAVPSRIDYMDEYYVFESTNIDIKNTLIEFVTKESKTWFYGPRGASGQVRDWFTNLFAKLVDQRSEYFELDSDGFYRLNLVDLDGAVYPNNKRTEYIGLGMVLAISLIEGYPMSVEFNPIFYEALLHKLDTSTLTRKDLLLNDRIYYTSWIYVADCGEPGSLSCDEVFEQSLEGTMMVSSDGKRDLVNNGKYIPVTVENIKDYSRLLLADYFNRYTALYEAISEGFDRLLPDNMFETISGDDMKSFLRGKTDLSAEQLKDSIRWPYSGHFEVGKQGYVWLNELFESEGQEFRNSFVKFSTSLSTPPLGGFVESSEGQGKIILWNGGVAHEFVDGKKNVRKPTSHTCVFMIDVPEYRSKEELLENLVEAFKNDNFGSSAVEADLLNIGYD